MNIDPGQYASVLVLIPGGEREVASGTVEELLGEFAQGRIGEPGGMFMRLAGDEDLILGRQLERMVEAFKAASID